MPEIIDHHYPMRTLRAGYYSQFDLVCKIGRKKIVQPGWEVYGRTVAELNKEIEWFTKLLSDKGDNRKPANAKFFKVEEFKR